MRIGLVCLTLTLLAVEPAIAEAYRAATPAEQSEIERSAVLYHENPHDYVPGTHVSVTNVKVSTAAPWALASVTLRAKATGEEFTDPEIFRPVDGTWTDVGPLNDKPTSMVPEAVAKDLGVPYLPSNESGTSRSGNTSTSGSSGFLHKTGFEIAVLAGWLLCIISLVSVGRHPTADFQGIGRSRWRWALISLLGIIPYVGIFTSVAYFFKVSIRLPKKERVPRPVQPPRGPQVPQGRPRRCDRCADNKWVNCHCGGQPTCPYCYGSGRIRCPDCPPG
jgi:hypothetical protein